MTSDTTPIYNALNTMAFLGTKGVTVSLSVKKDGSFDMTVNPHLLGMIDEDEEDDEEIDDVKDKERNQRCPYCEFTMHWRAIKDINLAGPCIGDENMSELCTICPYKSKV